MLPLTGLVVLFLYESVEATEVAPTVLVNKMIFEPQWQGDRGSIDYYYGDGDLVDVSCVSLASHCFVQLRLFYREYSIDTSQDLGSYLGVAFRTELKAIHSYSQLICTCAGSKLEIITTLILRNSFNDILNMTINGLTVRGISKDNQVLDIRIQSDKVIGNEDINVQLSTISDEVALNWHPPSNMGLTMTENNNRRINFTIPSGSLRLTVTLVNNRTKLLLGNLQIKFIEFPFTSSEYRKLVRNLPKENVLFEIYNYDGMQRIYYTYEEDEIMNFQCVTSSTLPGLMTVTGLEDIADSSYGNLTKKTMLSSREKNAVVQCKLENSNLVIGRASIVLWYKNPVLQILVNRVRLTTNRDPGDIINRSAIYHYKSGDLVDLSCVKWAHSCTVMLNFSHAGSSDVIFESTDLTSPDTIGFRTNLYDSDDKSHMVCKCICPNNTTTFKATFVLQNKIDDPVHNEIKLVINNRTVREMAQKQNCKTQSPIFVSLTYYSGYENIHVEAYTQKYDRTLDWDFVGLHGVILKDSKNDKNLNISIELDMKKMRKNFFDLHIDVLNRQKQVVMVKISFVILPRHRSKTVLVDTRQR